MSEVYIIRNQHHLYLNKQGEWVDGSDSHCLFRTAHRDEALNMKVELSVRDPQLRLALVAGALDEKGHLALHGSEAPGPAIDRGHNGLFRSAGVQPEESGMDHTADISSRAQQTVDSDV
jgi:hypothetical protein